MKLKTEFIQKFGTKFRTPRFTDDATARAAVAIQRVER
jgi:hypothetical protein